MATLTPWKKHLAKWSNCERCDLHCRRKSVVHLRGSIPCDVLFVGEAPGPSEDVLGKPFVGPAGKLLEDIIEQALGGSEFFHGYRVSFTNLVGCIPVDEDSDKFAEPPPDAIKACSPRLREIVEMCKPKLLAWVGKLAAKWGPKIVSSDPKSFAANYNSVELVHPAAILRAPEAAQGLMVQKAVVILSSAMEEL